MQILPKRKKGLARQIKTNDDIDCHTSDTMAKQSNMILSKAVPTRIAFITALLFTILTIPTFAADTTPPSSTSTQTPSSPNGKNGWYISPVEFKIDSTDLESGVKEISYRIDSGTWQTVTFTNSLNLAPNPSFETSGATTTGIQSWEASAVDPEASYSKDAATYALGFASSSAKIVATGGAWHAVNHKNEFAAAFPYSNMSASVWLRTQNVSGSAYFKIYGIDAQGAAQLIATSPTVAGTQDWTKIKLNFTLSMVGAVGAYLDIGLSGPGTLWIDAATLDNSATTASTVVTIASDSANHRLEFYGVDGAGNAEAYSCVTPKVNCIDFKLDQSTPGNWHDSGAFRSLRGSDHELWVYAFVKDLTSGMSKLSNRYQYHTEREEGFGRYENLLGCNSRWQVNQWASLINPPFSDGTTSDVLLLTQKTDFCNNNWKACKIVKFYAEDMAGNTTTKDFCINGPWIRVSGGGAVRSNSYIDMLAEPPEDNTDGIVDIAKTNIDFFTSSKDWYVRDSTGPSYKKYGDFWDDAGDKTELGDELTANDGVYWTNGDYEIKNSGVPSDYSRDTFAQIVFIKGDLTITDDITVDKSSAALFIVEGDVKIDEGVDDIGIAIFADGDFYTAYDADEDEGTKNLVMKGLFSADKFVFQRTSQGTGGNEDPSEDIIYEPKYLLKLKDYLGTSSVTWKNVE